jgi:hypothetical protein
MRKLALGSLAVAATAALAVPVLGLAGTAITSSSLPIRVPVAAAAESLPSFSSCDELLDWYVEKALPLVGPYGFGYPYVYDRLPRGGVAFGGRELTNVDGLSTKAAAPGAYDAVRNSGTGTNVQEAGVDEPDGAKTNGKLILRIEDRQLIITDVSGKDPVEVSRTELPKGFWGDELLLAGDSVIVFGQASVRPQYYEPMMDRIGGPYPGTYPNSRILSYSIATPKTPKLVTDQSFEGGLVEARQYSDTIRLVLQSGYPELDFVQPTRRRTEAEARKENKQILRESKIEDWLPTVVVAGRRTPFVGCGDVRHPLTNSGLGTLSIVTFDAAKPLDRTTTAVTTSGDLAYSSVDRLYVATPVDSSIEGDVWNRLDSLVSSPAQTEIHSFKLDGTSTTYLASGVVRGLVRDRWSFDEYAGNLRVATALTHNWDTSDNAITVLHEDGSKLKVVGSVRGIGPREDIQSVRWFEDLAVVVTFRQVDPLYTVDLSDPSKPKVLGALKIPGFSSYLHPLGDHKILGLGSAADSNGSTKGGQIATFDLRNLKDPKQLDVLRLGREDELVASYDPRGFTLVSAGQGYATVTSWDGYAHVIGITVSPSGHLAQTDSWIARSDTRIVPIDDHRVALVGRFVRIKPIG